MPGPLVLESAVGRNGPIAMGHRSHSSHRSHSFHSSHQSGVTSGWSFTPRSAPAYSGMSTNDDTQPAAPRQSYRTGARSSGRSSARTSYRGDSGAETFQPQETVEEKGTHTQPTTHQQELEARYIVHFRSRTQRIHAYEEEQDSYFLTGLTGGRTRYPKSMIVRIEPISPPKAALPEKAERAR